MNVEKVGLVFPVPDIATAVPSWRTILGVEPSFVDGARWAQFDVAGSRIALAGTDRFSESPGLMIKVSDCDAARTDLRRVGLEVSLVVAGEHERRAHVVTPGEWMAMLYSPTR